MDEDQFVESLGQLSVSQEQQAREMYRRTIAFNQRAAYRFRQVLSAADTVCVSPHKSTFHSHGPLIDAELPLVLTEFSLN